jgi:DNA-binding Lrp family transcriptional regulator
VPWVAELGGLYQYGFSLIFKHITEVDTFLSQLIPQGEAKIVELMIVPRIEWKWYPPKFWWAGCHATELTCGGSVPAVETDEMDHAILRALSLPECSTLAGLARHLGHPASTIEYRIQRLEKTGVIAGYAYSLDEPLLDLRRCVFLIQEKSFNAEFRKRIFNFCRQHPHVHSLIHCVGGWNFEVSFDLPREKSVAEARQELYDQVGIEHERIIMLDYFRTLKLTPYPPILG